MLGFNMLLGFIFPIHFSNFGEMGSKKMASKLEKERSFILKYSQSCPIEALRLNFAQVQIAIKDCEDQNLEFVRLNDRNRDLEAIIEGYASSVLMMSIWLMSLQYEQLNLFLSKTFTEQISGNPKVVVGLVSSLTALSCVFCVLRMRYVNFYWILVS